MNKARQNKNGKTSHGGSEECGGVATLPKLVDGPVVDEAKFKQAICSKFLSNQSDGLLHNDAIYFAAIDNTHFRVIMLATNNEAWQRLVAIRDGIEAELCSVFPTLNVEI